MSEAVAHKIFIPLWILGCFICQYVLWSTWYYQYSKPPGMQTQLSLIAKDVCLIVIMGDIMLTLTVMISIIPNGITPFVADMLAISCHVLILLILTSLFLVNVVKFIFLKNFMALQEISDKDVIKYFRFLIVIFTSMALVTDNFSGADTFFFHEILVKDVEIKR